MHHPTSRQTQTAAAGTSQRAGRRGNGGSASPAQLPQRRLYLFTRQTVLLGDTSGEMRINSTLLLLPLGSHEVIAPPSQPPVLWNSTCEEKLINIKQVGRRLPLPSAAKVILMLYFFYTCIAEEKPGKVSPVCGSDGMRALPHHPPTSQAIMSAPSSRSTFFIS